MKLIVGLGNPGPKYQLTRHNIGFLLIDALAEVFDNRRSYKSEFKAETQKIKIAGEPVMVCKPQTFMNLSGEAVQPLMKFYGLGLEDLLVAHDEIDVPFGSLRFQQKRGPGGHNGVKSLHQLLGSEDYGRLRLGVGRPPFFTDDGSKKVRRELPVHEWVLQNFSADEQRRLPELLEMAVEGVEVWVKSGISKASTLFNSRALPEGV
jgi:PTH1 family peptidyl-tRNA hydrolase